MAKLVTKLQRIQTGVTKAMAGYSRVVSCAGSIKAPAVTGLGYTESLGGRLWLLGVRVRFDPHLVLAADQVRFYIFQGQGVPQDAAGILNWRNILPCTLSGMTGVAWSRTQWLEDYVWSMRQLFEGEANRFGFWFSVSPAVVALEMRVSFEISEG